MYPSDLPDALRSYNKYPPNLGLDLAGGSQLTYQAHVGELPEEERFEALEGVRDVIERRVNPDGVSEVVVQTVGDDKLIIELPGVTDIEEAVNIIGETPLLEFKIENPAYQARIGKEPELTREQEEELAQLNRTVKSKADEIRADIVRDPESFASKAQTYSDDPATRNSGGDFGFIRRNQMDAIDDTLFDVLRDTRISSVIDVDDGYYIVQRLESRTAEDGNEEVKGRYIFFEKKTGSDIVPMPEPWKNTGLSGKHLEDANVIFDPVTLEPNIELTFNAEGADMFKTLTEAHIGKPIGIFLDGRIISAPVVQTAITDGVAIISSSEFTAKTAKELNMRLSAGAFPVPITLASQQTVDATLGTDSLQKSLKAGLLGLALVAAYMAIVYRLPGLLSVVALAVYAVVTLALYFLFGITLTLAGIAGFILSVGMAVDANILIFSRLREELEEGKTIRDAIEQGFARAWNSIRDSNISSLITSAILIMFGTSIVKGFAITLGIGILVSMFTAITATRTFLLLLPGGAKRAQWMFGVNKK